MLRQFRSGVSGCKGVRCPCSNSGTTALEANRLGIRPLWFPSSFPKPFILFSKAYLCAGMELSVPGPTSCFFFNLEGKSEEAAKSRMRTIAAVAVGRYILSGDDSWHLTPGAKSKNAPRVGHKIMRPEIWIACVGMRSRCLVRYRGGFPRVVPAVLSSHRTGSRESAGRAYKWRGCLAARLGKPVMVMLPVRSGPRRLLVPAASAAR